jgi:glyoxalase superfamily protein
LTALIRNITVDCADPKRLAEFWSEVTGFTDFDEDYPEIALLTPDGHPDLMFIAVPEGKTVKNRLHLCVQPTDRTRDEEVERLRGLGATMVDDLRNEDGTGWAVLADIEGNEFCVLRSAAERA